MLSHVTFIMKQDVSLGNELFKLVKLSQEPLAAPVLFPFGTALVLVLTSISSLEPKVRKFS